MSILFTTDDDSRTVANVLAGEVWVCAGQSNMEMPVKGFANCPVDGYNEIVAGAAQDAGVRSVKLPMRMSAKPKDDSPCQWRECSPETVADFSATGYFFARTVSRALRVPVGIIEANKGGTRVESWLDEANIRAHTDEPADSAAIVRSGLRDFHRPLLWGNGTFHPILNYTVKGILYYQGCSNVGDPGNRYSERMKLLVEQWRRDFGLGQLPFYFVEITPFRYNGDSAIGGALLREQQQRAADIIPNSALVSTNDCVYPYEARQIHPAQKQKIGSRLAYLALNKTYGMKSIICQSPRFRSATVEGGKVYVKLDHLEGGISRMDHIEGFEIAGPDGVMHPASATFSGRKGIELHSDRVKAPTAVSYCFRNFMLGNVPNQGGLPLMPFRKEIKK